MLHVEMAYSSDRIDQGQHSYQISRHNAAMHIAIRSRDNLLIAIRQKYSYNSYRAIRLYPGNIHDRW